MESKTESLRRFMWIPIKNEQDPDWIEAHINLGTTHVSVWRGDDMVYRSACVRPNGSGAVRSMVSLYKARNLDEAKKMALEWVRGKLGL
jgi:hypothetical protein